MSRRWIALSLGALACSTPGTSRAQDWRTTSSARQYAGESALKVDLQYGAGTLDVRPGAPGTLYRANMRYDAEVMTPRANFSDGVLRIDMEGRKRNVHRKDWKGNELQLQLGPQAPLDLELQFGAVQASLELGGLRIQEADIQTGASDTKLRFSRPNLDRCRSLRLQVGAADFEALQLGNLSPERLDVAGGVGDVTLDFSGEWKGDVVGEIRMGVGSLTLAIPRGIGVRIDKRSFLADFEPAGLVKRGNTYFSPGYESAKRRLNLDIEAALGSLEVRWLDGRTAAL
ncbi:MAG TPA: LiaF domain-containing protein [Longimicrobiales bacterium]|nr:LiaF domain-containing protein [Longimicrobiales bacterium]